MVSNKSRLYVALYARGGSVDTYHWALLFGPKHESEQARGKRCHAKERAGPAGAQWGYEELDISMMQTRMVLVRVVVAKIVDELRLVSILRNTPIRAETLGWTCKSWVKEALERLRDDGNTLGTSVVDWDRIEETAQLYVQEKKAMHRFDGLVNWPQGKVPTYDLILDTETVE